MREKSNFANFVFLVTLMLLILVQIFACKDKRSESNPQKNEPTTMIPYEFLVNHNRDGLKVYQDTPP